jgi:hypothetical protein
MHTYHDANRAFPPARLPNNGATWCFLILPYLEQDNLRNTWTPVVIGTSYTAAVTAGFNAQAQVKTFFCPSRRGPTQISKTEPSSTDPVGALGDYAGCAGDDPSTFNQLYASGLIIPSLASGASQVSLTTIPDGTSSTLLLGDKNVPLDAFGLYKDANGQKIGDSCIYNGNDQGVVTRVVGLGMELISNPLAHDTVPSSGSSYMRRFGSVHTGVCQFALADGHVHAFTTSTSGVILAALATRAGIGGPEGPNHTPPNPGVPDAVIPSDY